MLWSWVSDVVVPVVAVLLSAGVAIWLARGERKAGERARAEERRVLEDARYRQLLEDRLMDTIRHVGYFVSFDPVQDSVRMNGAIQELRVQAKMIQALPDERYREFGEWLAGELHRGLGVILKCMDSVSPDMSKEERVISVMAPARRWVDVTLNLIVLWMRGGVSVEDLRAWSDGAAARDWVMPDEGDARG